MKGRHGPEPHAHSRNSEAGKTSGIKATQLTVGAIRGRTVDSLEGAQTFFAHLAPVLATLHHGLASGVETASDHGHSEFIEFLFLRGQMRRARLQLGLCRAEFGRRLPG